MKKTTLIFKHLAIAAALIVTVSAKGSSIVFNNDPSAGSQQNYVLGMDFIVNTAVTVTELGAFDSGGDGFFTGTIHVGIFDLGGTLIGSAASFTGKPGTLIDGSRFVAVTPFILAPGTYSIVAAGFTGVNFSGNTQASGETTAFDSDGGALSLVSKGGRWDSGNSLYLPTANSGGYGQPDPVFQAGTFAVAGNAGTFTVPDGGMTAALLGGALIGLQTLRRKMAR